MYCFLFPTQVGLFKKRRCKLSNFNFNGKSFVLGIGTASVLISIILGIAALLIEKTDFKLVDKNAILYRADFSDTYVDKSLIEQDFIDKKQVEQAYISKAELAATYIKKSDVDKVTDSYILKEEVKAQYVAKPDFVALQKKYDDLQASVTAIPSPFKSLSINLSDTNNWRDDRLGVSILNLTLGTGAEGEIQATFTIDTPNTAQSKIQVNEYDYEFFVSKFIVLNRTFEVSISDFDKMTFVIKEI